MQIERRGGRVRGEADAIVEWRREQLVAHDFDPDLALSVALQADVDLHALIELVERGCPPILAVRILAPLDLPRVERVL
jgi:hypothetical protein